MTRWICLSAIFICGALAASCGSSSASTPIDTPLRVYLVQGPGTTGAVYGSTLVADPRTTASIQSGSPASATVNEDGSFVILLDPLPASATVVYTKNGVVQTHLLTPVTLASRVIKPLLQTSSGPNDIVASADSFYVACAMDNLVVRYALDGSVLGQHSFDVATGPSYLAHGTNILWVIANGTNTVTGLDDLTMSALGTSFFQLNEPGMGFIGPSQPVDTGDTLFIPRNEIISFGPAVYGAGKVTRIDESSGTVTEFTTVGHNPSYTAYDSIRRLLYVVSTGEIQFDQDYNLTATTHSLLEVYNVDNTAAPVATLDLGLIAAGRIALTKDGNVAYLGNALNGNVYKVDLASMIVTRDASNPIQLTTEKTFISDVFVTPDQNWVLATSYNTDQVFVIDVKTDTINPPPYFTPFDLKLDPVLMAGSLALTAVQETDTLQTTAFVVYALANSVAAVSLF